MALDTNIKKPKTLEGSDMGRIEMSDRRRLRWGSGPRRSLLRSRLTRLIILSNLVGLIILVLGALTMNRFEAGLIEAKLDNLRSLSSTISTVMSDSATGATSAAKLDVDIATQVLRGINTPDNWRVRLYDRQGLIIVDSQTLDKTISVSTLDPIITDPEPDPPQLILKDRAVQWARKMAHNLPWRAQRRASLRRDLRADIRTALGGDVMSGARYTKDDQLIVTVSQPVKRVQQVLAVVTVESSDVDHIINGERRALAPIIGLAFLAAMLSSLALILFITMPMRKLARAAELVTRSSSKRDAIPDLSKRRDEIGDLSIVMGEMTQGLYGRIDDIANFAADVAHEIKNPLTSLRSASDTLRGAKSDAQRAKLIDIIQQDVSRMDRLITDISKASKVDANLARETAQALDISQVLSAITEFYAQTRESGAAKLVNNTQLSADEAVFIRAFETPFAQVLRNLIDNALTFSAKDGQVRLKAVLIQDEQGRERVRLTVDDDGPGIPEDNLETVFERFYTQRPKGAEFGSHSGLGLAICRQIITAHKGRIWAENRRAEAGGATRGARFIIDVPRLEQGGGPQSPKRRSKQKRKAA